jgi:AAA domain
VVVALGGPSGSGKSTAARLLAQRTGWVRLDEAYDRLVPRPSLEYGSERELRALELRLVDEEARRYRDALREARRGRTVVADTGFLDPVAYTAGLFVLGGATAATFRAVLRRAGALAARGELGLADLTVYLSVGARTRLARASRDPVRHPPALRPRHERVGRVDATLVRACLAAAAPGRVLGVSSAATAASVADTVARLAGRTTPLPDPPRAVATALDELARRSKLGPASVAPGNLMKATPLRRPPR